MAVSLKLMKNFLRVDHDEDDELIMQLITSAEERCRGVSRNDDLDSDPNAAAAIMYAAAYLYEHREDADLAALNLTLRAMLFDRRRACF